MKNFFHTSEKLQTENYPYGYLKTTAFFSLEFNPKKGFRSVFQTINPKNGRVNAPKKSTYSSGMALYQNEEGHIKTFHFGFNGREEMTRAFEFLKDNWHLFTPEQIKYFYMEILLHLKVTIKSMVIYCASDFETLKPLFEESIQLAVKGAKTGDIYFNCFPLLLDWEKIEATKKPDFNPFKVTETYIMDGSGLRPVALD